MKFETARNVVKVTIVLAILCCLAGLITKSSETVSNGFAFAGLGLIIITLFVAISSLKCPYCNTRIFRKCLVLKVCPHCHRDLSSGAKVKGKKAKM